MDDVVGLHEIEAARTRIAAHIVLTPLHPSPGLSRIAGHPVHLKLETRQVTGSFKLRGATHAICALSRADRARGLVTASTGNHGRAVAHAAREMACRAVVCMSALVPANKVEAVRALGAEIRIVGHAQDDAQAEVARLVAEEGFTEVPPFDHRAVIAGQGTIGLEVLDALPDLETILIPLSGGGLAAGIAAAVKARRPGARVIGASMSAGAAMHASLAAGHPVVVEEVETLADSLGGGIGLANRYTFRMCRDLLDDAVLVDEAEIAAAIRYAQEAEREVVEGAGAVGIAALLAGRVKPRGPCVAVVSGRNIDPQRHQAIVAGRPWPARAG